MTTTSSLGLVLLTDVQFCDHVPTDAQLDGFAAEYEAAVRRALAPETAATQTGGAR